MDAHTLDLLRKQQLTRRLPDGREAITVTIQYRGELPVRDRAERRRWLGEEFSVLDGCVEGLTVEPDSLSVSGQTVNVVVPLEGVDDLRAKLPEVLDMQIPVYRQIVDRD